MSMKFIRVAAGTALVGLLGSAVLFAQTPSPPESTTSPSAASTPAQRDATHSSASEATTTPGTEPSDASTPHQRQAAAGHTKEMKACMDRQAKATPQASKSEMTKACNEQMEAQKEHLSEAHPNPPTDNSSPAPAPR